MPTRLRRVLSFLYVPRVSRDEPQRGRFITNDLNITPQGTGDGIAEFLREGFDRRDIHRHVFRLLSEPIAQEKKLPRAKVGFGFDQLFTCWIELLCGVAVEKLLMPGRNTVKSFMAF